MWQGRSARNPKVSGGRVNGGAAGVGVLIEQLGHDREGLALPFGGEGGGALKPLEGQRVAVSKGQHRLDLGGGAVFLHRVGAGAQGHGVPVLRQLDLAVGIQAERLLPVQRESLQTR